MSLDRDKLKYLLTRLKEIFATRKELNHIATALDEPPIYTQPESTIIIQPKFITHNKNLEIIIDSTFTPNDAGDIIYYELKKNGEVIFSNQSITTYKDVITLQHGDEMSYTSIVRYNDGMIKNTKLGHPYPNTSIKSDTIEAMEVVKCYAENMYRLIDEEGNETELNRFLNCKKEYTLTISLHNQRIVYKYPKSFGELKSIKDIHGFDYMDSYELTTELIDDVEYLVYSMKDPVTIPDFIQDFK